MSSQRHAHCEAGVPVKPVTQVSKDAEVTEVKPIVKDNADVRVAKVTRESVDTDIEHAALALRRALKVSPLDEGHQYALLIRVERVT